MCYTTNTMYQWQVIKTVVILLVISKTQGMSASLLAGGLNVKSRLLNCFVVGSGGPTYFKRLLG